MVAWTSIAGMAGNESAANQVSSQRRAHIVRVPLPIAGTVDSQVKQAIERALAGEQVREDGRPVVVLEFKADGGQTGRGSEFERCLSLARFVSGDALRGARAVAYIPNDLMGHAVLPVLACEEIIINPEATLGSAGIDEVSIDEVMRRGYRETVERRRTIPVAIALAMLDREVAVHRVVTLDGIVYVPENELPSLQRTTTVSSIETVVQQGDHARLTGRELRLKYGFVSHLARDQRELAAALGLPPDALGQVPLGAGAWLPSVIEISGNINANSVNWILRSAQRQIENEQCNLLCVMIDSPGGSAEDSLRLAGFLSGLDPAAVHTVAFIPHEARGDAALVALACDDLVMPPDALLGGPGAEAIAEKDRDALHAAVRGQARQKGRDWSLPAAIADPRLTVFECSRPGSALVRYFSEEELAEQPAEDGWTRGNPIPLEEGLRGHDAERFRLVKHRAANLGEIRRLYGWETDLAALRPNWAHRFIEYLASPRLAAILLFVACFACFVELSTPGIGIPGFVAALCFVIYFWSHFLNGTAGWLEVLLFLCGATAIALELLVVPGTGIFGFGGAVLIISSIILASQTFVIPRNAYQLTQLPKSLATVVAAIAGASAAILVMRRYLPETPLFKHLLLRPLDDAGLEELDRREALADFDYLVRKRGITVTPLNPSGKARFGDDVVGVITQGEAVDAGSDIVVTEVQGNRVVVRPVR